MRTAIYPGSFNPWHEGHEDILDKALKIFDHIIIAKGVNISKNFINWHPKQVESLRNKFNYKLVFVKFEGLLVEYVKKQTSGNQRPDLLYQVRNLW